MYFCRYAGQACPPLGFHGILNPVLSGAGETFTGLCFFCGWAFSLPGIKNPCNVHCRDFSYASFLCSSVFSYQKSDGEWICACVSSLSASMISWLPAE